MSAISKKGAIVGSVVVVVFVSLFVAAHFVCKRNDEKMHETSLVRPTTASFELSGELRPFFIAVWQDAYPDEVERIHKRLQAAAFRPRDGSIVEKDEVNPSLVGLHGWERNVIKGWFSRLGDGSISQAECKVELVPSENRLTVCQDEEAIREFESRFGQFLKRLE